MVSTETRKVIVRFSSRAIAATILATVLLIGGTSRGQNMFYHLLSGGAPVANFTSASQTILEANGVWSGWPASLNAWAKRREIVLAGPTSTLTNFPVMIKVDATRITYVDTQAAGQDLRFTDSSGALLAHEIEYWNASGTSIVWVKVPTYTAAPATTSIYMYYGSNAAADGQSSNAVWTGGHVGVWHLNAALTDSTASGMNGANNGASSATGQISGAYSFNGTSNTMDMGTAAPANLTGDVSVEAWVKLTTASGDYKILSRQSGTAGGYKLGIQGGKLEMEIRNAANAFFLNRAVAGGTTLSTGVWYHFAGVYSQTGGYIRTYVNGVLDRELITAGILGTSTTNLYFSREGSVNSYWLPGVIDEARISNVARSADWMAASYASGNDTLATYGSEETLGGSSIAVVTVQLDRAALTNLTIPYVVSGTATALTDHTRASGSLTILSGSNTGSLDTQIIRDNLVEGDETAILTLGAGTGYVVGATNVHTITITDELLSPPDAVDDAYTVTSLSAQIFSVIANDTDANGDPLTITAISTPSSGTAVRVGQTIQYTPSGDFGTSDSFTYTISDGRGGSDTATVTITYEIPFTWIGAGADANWTTLANWQGGVVPGASDTAYFNNACTTFCDPIQTANIAVGGIGLNSSYAGTVTQAAGFTWSVGAGGWTQRAGTFNGSNADITINGSSFRVLGGTFTSTTNTFLLTTVSGSANITIFTVSGTGSFLPNSGTVKFNGKSGWSFYPLLTIDVPDFFEFNHLILHQGAARNSNGISFQPVTGRTIVIKGNLTHGTGEYTNADGTSKINGLWNLEGNLIIGSDAVGGSNSTMGVVTLTGTGAQTITGDDLGYTTDLAINKASGAVTVTSTNLRVRRFLLDQGTFTAPTGILESFYYFPGGSTTTTIFRIVAATTFNTNGGTVKLTGVSGWSFNSMFELDVPDLFAFNNLVLGQATSKNSNTIAYRPISSRTIITNGNFSHGGSDFVAAGGNTIVHGSWQVKGNYTIGTDAFGGTAAVTLNGTGAQSITVGTGATMPTGNFFVDKASGTATMATAASFNTAAQTVTVTAGILDMAGFNLTVNSTISVAAGAKLLCNGGLLAAGSYNMLGEVSCGPSAGISWTGTAGDNLWNTAGNWTNNTIPGASDIALFNGMCAGANCNVTMPAVLSVKGLRMNTGYTGTITAGATSVTIGTSGWTQVVGTYTGGAAPMTLNGPFALSGGTFTAPTNNVNLATNFSVTGSPTFTATGSTLRFVGTTSSTTLTITPGTVSYNNVEFPTVSSCATHDLSGGTMDILGTLTVASSGYCTAYGRPINNGTLRAYGNVTLGGVGATGSATILLAGNASGQTLAGSTGATLPSLAIAAGVNNVTMTGAVTLVGNYTMTSVGTFTATGSTLGFTGITASTTITIAPGAVIYDNVSFPTAASCSTFDLGGGTMNVAGTLLVSTNTYCTGSPRPINNGILSAQGNITFADVGAVGSVVIRAVGSTSQTITGIAAAAIPSLTIASTGGTVTLVGTLPIRGNYTYTSGVVDAGTSTLDFVNGTSLTPGAVAYNNVNFGGYTGSIALTGTITVNGALAFKSNSTSPTTSLNGGTILASGDVSSTANGMIGSVALRVVGSGNQTISGVATAAIPSLEIASTGGTVTLSGTPVVATTYLNTSGVIDPGTSTLVLASSGYTQTPGALAYNNVTIAGYSSSTTLSGTLTVNGTTNLASTSSGPPTLLNTGSIVANGDVVYGSNGMGGNASLTFGGATTKNLTFGSSVISRMSGAITVAKTGGASVVMMSNSSFGNAGQDVTVASGILDLGGYDLAVTDILTVDTGATLRCNGGSFTQGTLVNNGTLNCPGTASYEFNWTGTAADGNWNTAANWQGGIAPTASSIVVFDDAYCGANCNVLMNATVNIRGMRMMPGYTGTITQAPGVNVTIGQTGWTQAGGIFAGSNAVFQAVLFSLTGGTFTAPANVMNITLNSAIVTGVTVFRVGAGATFTHNGGTLKFDYTNSMSGKIYFIDVDSSLALNNLEYWSSLNIQVIWQIASGDTLVVNGGFTIDSPNTGSVRSDGGTIQLKGNATATSAASGGTTNLVFSGSSAQTYSAAGTLPATTIDNTGGGVTSLLANAAFSTFKLQQGIFTAPSGTMTVSVSSAFAGGSTVFNVMSGTTFIHNNGTLMMHYGNSAAVGNYVIDVDTSLSLYNLRYSNQLIGIGWNLSGTDTLVVNGDFTMQTSGSIVSGNGGTIDLKGNALFASGANGGTTQLLLSGTAMQTVNRTAGVVLGGNWTVNKPSGSVVLANALSLAAASQALTITAGTFDMAGYALTVAGAVTNSGTLKRGNSPSCGTLTNGSFSGTAAICP